MLISQHNSHVIITTDAFHHYCITTDGNFCLIHPYDNAPTTPDIIKPMLALHSLVKKKSYTHRLVCEASPFPLPRYLHALRIHNLNLTDAENTEHIIHTNAPRYIAHVDPSTCLPETITPIDTISSSSIPTLLLNAQVQLDKILA
jgi:hypothetical protein